MSTIDSKKIIIEILQNDGSYPGDPKCENVYEFTNAFGNTAWAVYWPFQGVTTLQASEFVINPILLWSKTTGLTSDGQKFLDNL